MTVVEPRLTLERRLLRERPLVIALDEVGRGALAGPVAVGATVMDERGARRRIPQGLRDSKLVPEQRRADVRSEERRVGKECGYQCRSRWSPYH